MLRRNFLRLLAALPALPFVGRAKAKPIYEYRVVPMTGSKPTGGSYTLTDAGDYNSFTTYVWNESRQKCEQLLPLVGDGVTDNTEAIRQRFETGFLFLPRGEYVVRDPDA